MLATITEFIDRYKSEWFTYPWYYEEIASYVKLKGYSRFIELGSYRGHSICYLCDKILKYTTSDKIEIYTVDTFKPTRTSSSHMPEGLRDLCFSNIKRMGKENIIKVLECTSHEASLKFENEYFDFVYIDADHVYERIKEDIDDWLPKVKAGGILAGHDYAGSANGIKKAVDEKFGDHKRLKANSVWEVIK